jgi:hypothetical protein
MSPGATGSEVGGSNSDLLPARGKTIAIAFLREMGNGGSVVREQRKQGECSEREE